MSKGPVAWNLSGFSSAILYPFPFLVKTCINTGPSNCLLIFSILSNSSISWPSTGPKYLNPISSKNILGIINCLILLFILCIILTIGFPTTGILLTSFFIETFDLVYVLFVLNLLSNILTPPIFLDILISLSFNITVNLVLLHPASFNASKAIPPVKAPSPITANTELFSFSISLALAIPNATDIDVLLCPVSKQSVFDSFILGNPAIPSNCLNVFSFSLLPVIILCT